jgi:hypothetical protein
MKIYTFLLALVVVSAHASTIKAKTSGNWMTPQTWSCNCVPQSGDQVVIPEGIVIAITKPVTARSIQIIIYGELAFNNGSLQIDENDKITLLLGGKVVAKGSGGTIHVGLKMHYFEHGRMITGPATIGKTIFPIALISFKADSNQGRLTLSWTSAGEMKVKRYEILSSTDSVTFQMVGGMNGSNSTFRRKDYTFPIENTTSEMEFYRLEAIRNDSARVILTTVNAK